MHGILTDVMRKSDSGSDITEIRSDNKIIAKTALIYLLRKQKIKL